MDEEAETHTETSTESTVKTDPEGTSIETPNLTGTFTTSSITDNPVHLLLSIPFTNQLTASNSCESSITHGTTVDAGTGTTSDVQLVLDVDSVQTVQKNENSSLDVFCAVSSGTSTGPMMVAIPVSSHLSSDSMTTYHSEDLHQHPAIKKGNEETMKALSTTVGSPVEVLPVNSELVPITYSDDVTRAEINGKQYLFLTDNAAGIGLNNFQSINSDESGEPSVKKFKVESEDGHSYILTLAGDTQTANVGETQISEHQYQTKQEVTEIEVKGIEKRNQLLGSDVSQAWFTTRDDKNILQSSGATWKQGQWTKDEVDLLQININEYCRFNHVSDPTEIIFEMSKDERKEFYRTIAKGLQRPLFSVYRRVTRMYDQKNHMGKYTPEEISRLRELRRKHGNDWATIGQVMGRSASSVKDKCRLLKDTCNSGKWLPEEEKRLTQAVYELTGCEMGANVVHGLAWSRVAEKVLTRSEKQCRTKWLNYMNWKQQGGKLWTREDDMNLIYRITSSGVGDDTEIDWTELAKNWDSVRSPQWLRGKWWSLKRHIPDYQLIPFPDLLENMKTFYLHNVRARSTILATNKLRSVDLDSEMTYIPISLNGDLSHDGNGLGEMDSGVQAYEVLQHLPTGSGSYIITQPQGADGTLQASLSEHIIVQTVPISQGGDGDLGLQNRVVIRVPSSTDLNVSSLESSDLGTSIQLSEPMDQEQSGYKLTEESGISHNDSLSDDTTFHTDNLEQSVISSPSDVIGIKQESFVQSESTDLMTSFSDPMLNSNSNSLIGHTSDVETDKTHPVDIIGNM